MENTAYRAIAIVGAGAVLPQAPNVPAFWSNIKNGRYSIEEVPPERWDPAVYYDADPAAPDKTYSKIGGWVRGFKWDPKWRLPVPPRVVDAMDEGQKWGVACAREALEDYGYPERPLDLNRTAVILGNAMAGEKHYLTTMRVCFPEFAHELAETARFADLPEAIRRDIIREYQDRIAKLLPEITEDTMPGELANCLAGRIANLFNLRGPNFTADAACASTMAALAAASEGLIAGDFDAAITGGIDRNMGVSSFVKFCKIGALSPTGSRPYAEGADGFVMGEGAALFLLKRLADAERDGDKIYAVLRGIGGSSDGKGKGITAPNPIGQKLCIERAWQKAGLSPATVTYVEGHGTSTRVGDVVEVNSLAEVLSAYSLPAHSVAIGSVKSNIGHLKPAAGAAGMLKLALALRDKVLPPSVQCKRPNPDIDFEHSPLYVNTTLEPWTSTVDGVRRGALSAFGFGGTNFHAIFEEYIPHRLNGNGKRSVTIAVDTGKTAPGSQPAAEPSAKNQAKAPLRGALLLGAANAAGLAERLREVHKAAAAGRAPAPAAPLESDLRAPERLAIDYGDAAELADKASKAIKALAADQAPVWKALRAQGIFRGRGAAPKVAFLYTGQGSQYVNMLRTLRDAEPIVAETFAEADRIMSPLLGKPLSEYVFVDAADPEAVEKSEADLRETAITQPTVLAIDLALTRLLAAYGIQPDMTMGHSLGEYGALVASGALPFDDAMLAVSARGRGMTEVAMQDNGKMAAVFAPLAEIERTLKSINGYVVIANINSGTQAVIGGASKAVEEATEAFLKAGYNAVPLPVSHAFHTSIVAPASGPLRLALERLRLTPPRVPIVANVNGEFYPTGPGAVPRMLDLLGQQVASPVQFVKGLRTLYAAGARVFVEVGPKKALQGFAEDVLGANGDVLALFTNHPKFGDIVAFNQALCGLYAAGLGRGADRVTAPEVPVRPEQAAAPMLAAAAEAPVNGGGSQPIAHATATGDYAALGRMFAEVLERGWEVYRGGPPSGQPAPGAPVTITGAALGLPGTSRIFDDANVSRILRGEQLIDLIPARFRRAMADKQITRLVKRDAGGSSFEAIDSTADVIKLAGRGGAFDLQHDFGISAERVAALDRVTQLAIAVGIDAMRDAGIPLVMRYKTTSKGTSLPDRWQLPEALRDDTGVIFASCWPGSDSFADEMSRYYADRTRREQIATLESLRAGLNGDSALNQELARRIDELRAAIDKEPYHFDRRFLFRTLSMGHSQFAELIGARGPNTQINAACASTTQATALAEDWIRAGRCRRVIVISADDITSDHLLEWMGSGFLATGAAATSEVVEETALPFDRRRNGMIIGMGAAALVIEAADAARERGIRPISELLSAVVANSAFHGTRLDVAHIGQLMEKLVAQAEKRCGVSRHQMAPKLVFVSHETYTPARGGSAAAEIHALRHVFKESADRIVIANTKGFTGHAMGAGIEDVLAVKALETGWVPPVANFKEADPELGVLNLSRGGVYPIEFALRLGAGFGSQICMSLSRWVPAKDGVRPGPDALGYAYRISDREAWQAWLKEAAHTEAPELEVAQRTLRVHDARMSAAPPARVKEHQIKVAVEVKVPSESKPAPESKAAEQPAAVAARQPAQSRERERAVTPSPAAPPEPASSADPVREKVLAVVAEKTGYPPEMLALDLDLEADLGVDTVKQAEVFAAIREAYNIPREANLKLRDFPTLAHVIRFVYDRRGDVVPPAPAPAPPEPAPAVASARAAQGDAVQEKVLEIVAEKTGYPKDMLALDLDLEADLGVDTVKQAEVFAAIREFYNIPREANLKLRDFPTLSHVIGFVYDRRGDVVPPAPAPVPPAPVAAVPADQGDAVQNKVLEIVAEKTGYPKDMLALDLDLEADLGVDTVKQAEVFAAIREFYSIPRDANLKLRDFPTLSHVIGFVYDRRGDIVPPAPAPVPPEPAPAVAAAVPAAQGDAVQEKVLEIVAEKTGYPKDMLALDLDLEADLGVDTVKQAEVFAAIRETYNIPRDANLKLRDFPTLSHVIGFVYDRRGDIVPPSPAAAPPPTPSAVPVPAAVPAVPAAGPGDVLERLLDIVSEKTGYPKDMLDPDLDLEADLGIDTVKQAEVFAAIRQAYDIPREANLKLRDFPTLSHVVRFVHEKRGDAAPAAPEAAPAPAQVPLEAAPAAAAEQSAQGDLIQEKVLEIVAEKTGYPKDMLDLDLDLEADLGVDTVKQAEVFAAVREAYNIPRDTNLKLRDFPTLAHVIRFARERFGQSAAPAPVEEKPAPPPLASFDAAERVPRRVPVPMPRPPLELSKPTGVSLDGSRRVVIAPDKSGTAEALAERLSASGVEVLSLADTADAESRMKEWLAAGPVHGVYWLPALDNEGSLDDMDLATWREALRVRVKSLYATMRALYEQEPFLVAAVRLGGRHGYDDAGAEAPLGGAVAGFTKTYKRERENALVKVVDFEAALTANDVAALLIDETLRDPGAVEVGYQGGLRWTIGLQEQPAADGRPGLTLDKDTVFLITGAAGSIVSAITADLAAASGGTFYLLDLAPEPDPADSDLERFVTDREGLKRELAARIQARGQRATPVMVEKELALLERIQAAWSAIGAVRAAGGTAHYFSVNLTDAEAVADVVKQVRERSGRIDVLLHAAGLERSHFLPAKDPREFDLVFDVKADGWFNLLRAIGGMPLKAAVAFSSIAARFGNAGQADYSAANDLLCKFMSNFRTTRPDTRGIAIDWTAWGGIGMASRGSIPKMMEFAGIDMLAPEAGIPLVRRELTVGATRGEVVIAARLGILLKEWDDTGGLDMAALERPGVTAQGPMIGKVVRMGLHNGVAIETTLDPAVQPFLNHHRIDGTAVLPGVMGIEAFAEAASLLLPGWHVEAVENMDFLAPFKFYRDDPRTLLIETTSCSQGASVVADCRLAGRRTLPNLAEPQVTTHFTGRVRLARQPDWFVHAPVPWERAGSVVEAAEIYRFYFHGPAYQVLQRVWLNGGPVVGELAEGLPPNHHPAGLPLAIGPRLIELCFQTAGVWEMTVHGRMGLPLHIDRVRVSRALDIAGQPLYAVVTPHPDRGCFDAEVVDTEGRCYVSLSGYRTVAFAEVPGAGLLKSMYAVMA